MIQPAQWENMTQCPSSFWRFWDKIIRGTSRKAEGKWADFGNPSRRLGWLSNSWKHTHVVAAAAFALVMATTSLLMRPLLSDGYSVSLYSLSSLMKWKLAHKENLYPFSLLREICACIFCTLYLYVLRTYSTKLRIYSPSVQTECLCMFAQTDENNTTEYLSGQFF